MSEAVKVMPRPVLWRLVRSILNPTRLRILRLVYLTGGHLCVREISKSLNLDDPIASIYLRQMNAQGLLGVERQEIKVFYNNEPETAWPESVRLRNALEVSFAGKLEEGWETALMTRLRAFSHFNRLAMLARLLEGPASVPELKNAVGTCVKTLEHHLGFLYSAGLLRVDEGKVIHLIRPTDVIGSVLVAILEDHIRTGVSYRNVVTDHPLDRASKFVLQRIVAQENLNEGRWMEQREMVPVPAVLTNATKMALREDAE